MRRTLRLGGLLLALAIAGALIFGSVRNIESARAPRTSPCPPYNQADHSYLCLVTINLDRHSHRTHALIATGEAAGAAVLLGVSVLAIRRRRRPVTPS
jgi:O-antigen ligase